MKCPNCNSETSDMSLNCELCGASLYQGAPGEVLLPPDRGRTSRPKDPWYTSPLLYGVGIVILLVIIGSVVA
ncbi:MAG: hypothetical protein CVT63_07925, partial [Candidatus Anoxymicrobium japonicum]